MYIYFSAVDFICDEPRIRAISFVGSDRVGKYIYERGTANGKRVQSNMVCYYTIYMYMWVKYNAHVQCTCVVMSVVHVHVTTCNTCNTYMYMYA